MAFAVRAKAHRVDVQITPTTQPEDLEGKYVPDDTPGSQKNWKFEEGPVLRAWYKGYYLTLQEINYAMAGSNSCLNKYLDGTLYIEINGKVYHRHPNFAFLATMNAGYEDTEKLSQALKNRYSIVQLQPLTEAEFCQRIIAHSEFLGHKISSDFAKEIFNFSNFMQKQSVSGTWHENVDFGYRNAERFLDDILLKPRSLELFSSALHAAYTNALSCDNNNTEKLVTFKKSEEIQGYIKKLYSFYDFSESKAVDTAEDFDDIFGAVEDEPAEEEVKSDEMRVMDELYDKFDL
jgi:MoxR-like ATPase